MTLAETLSSGAFYNPYDFANPVDSADVFAGREGELKEIRYYLDQAARAPRPINLTLTGERSAGKTSLLNMIAAEARQRGFCVARVNLNESDADQYFLFAKIYDSILMAAMDRGSFGGPNGQVYHDYRQVMDGATTSHTSLELLFPQHLANAMSNRRALSESVLDRDLKTITKALTTPTVVIFDECNVLAQSRVELEMLRNVFMNLAGYMLVLAGTPSLFPVMEDVFSPIIRQFKKVPVGSFTNYEETTACLKNPLYALGIDAEDVMKPSARRLASEVHRISGGRPYEIQLLSHFMFKRVQLGSASNLAITLDVLDDVKVELEKQGSGTNHSSLDSLPKLGAQDLELLDKLTACRGTITDLAALAALQEDDAGDEAELEQGYEKLASLGLLSRQDDGTIRFAGDQFDEVYARYYAASQGIRLFIGAQDFTGALANRLRATVIESADLVPLYWGTPEGLTPVRFKEALDLLLNDEPADRLPELTGILYGDVWESFNQSKIGLGNVTVRLRGAHVDLWVRIRTGLDTSLTGDPDMVTLNDRVGKLGGVMEAQTFSYDLKDRDAFFERILRISLPSQRTDFADYHVNAGIEAVERGDHALAADEFARAATLDPTPEAFCRQAYAALLRSDWDGAIDFAGSARLAQMAGAEDEDLEHYLFASYDLAVAMAIQGCHDTALVLLAETQDLFTYFPEKVRGYVAILAAAEGRLQLDFESVEVLRDAVDFALDIIGSKSSYLGITDVASIEVELR